MALSLLILNQNLKNSEFFFSSLDRLDWSQNHFTLLSPSRNCRVGRYWKDLATASYKTAFLVTNLDLIPLKNLDFSHTSKIVIEVKLQKSYFFIKRRLLTIFKIQLWSTFLWHCLFKANAIWFICHVAMQLKADEELADTVTHLLRDTMDLRR